ncbi:MAG: beta-ketoacyl synthase N-terminal-like domain-containing protein [Planctomycetota bacterium]
MTRNDVVITGVGVVSAVGIGREAFFEALKRGDSGVRWLGERVDGDLAPSDGDADAGWIGAPILDFEPKKHVKPRKALKVMSREVQMGFASAHLALQTAGLADQIPATDDGEVKPERLGTVYGGEIYFSPPRELMDAIVASVDEQGDFAPGRFGTVARQEVMPLWMLKYLPNMPACQVGISINSQGPNNSLIVGDVSGPASLIEGISYLSRDLADVVVVGATGTRIAGARLSYRQDFPVPASASIPENSSRPHDPSAPGVVGGEGSAAMVIERESFATERGAAVLARVVGTASRFIPTEAMRFDERSVDLNPARSRGARAAIEAAIGDVLKTAEATPTQVGLVVSHAVGDRSLDRAEAEAVQASGIDCPCTAIAASIGHTGAASGMLELATAALATESGIAPPTRNLSVESQPVSGPLVLCLSHSTNGNAIAVLLGKAD